MTWVPRHTPPLPESRLGQMLAFSVALHAAGLIVLQPRPLTSPAASPPIEATLQPLASAKPQASAVPRPAPAIPDLPLEKTPAPQVEARADVKSAKPSAERSEVQPKPALQTDAALPEAAVPVSTGSTPAAQAPELARQPATAAPNSHTPEPPAEAASRQPASAPAGLAVMPMLVDTRWYAARELDVQPRAVAPIRPDYPYAARRDGVEGSVRLRLKIDETGQVQAASVESGDPPGVFDASALAAFSAARFVPAQRAQRPVRAEVLVRVVFKLD